MPELSDAEYVTKLIKQVRLVIATDDEIPAETKLETQPMLKQLEATLSAAPDLQDRGLAQSQYDFLCGQLDDYPNVMALLGAMRNFVPYL